MGQAVPPALPDSSSWKDSLDALLGALFLESFETPPEEIVLDLDTTEVELNGKQGGVDYVFGVPRNGRLRRLIAPQLAEAAAEHARTGKPARQLYEDLYCARADMENRIKEQFHLFAGRASTETMRANQFRMYLSGMAYVQVGGLGRPGLKATELAPAQAATIREKLFKIGARVKVSVRRVWLSMASSSPHQGLFQQVWANLRCQYL